MPARSLEASPPAPDEIPEFGAVEAAILLPTLNEEEGLARTLDELPLEAVRRAGWRVSPIVIDGGSTDGTVRAARERKVPVLVQRTKGKGYATREALAWLREHGVRFAIILDADHTYPAADIGNFLSLLGAGADLVIGVRYPEHSASPPLRDMVHRAGNALLNYSASQLSQHPILDLCSGYYGVDLQRGLDLNLEATGFEVEAEMFLKAYRSGLTVVQVPITYRTRIGEAKLRATRDGVRILFTILRVGRSPPAVARGPDRSAVALFRELLSIGFVHGASRLVVWSAESREGTASELAALLRGSRISSQLVLGRTEGTAVPALRADRLDVNTAVVVLPDRPSDPRAGAFDAFVVMPKTARVVFLGTATEGRDRRSRETPERTLLAPSYQLEFHSDRPGYLKSIRALGASLDPRLESKELALLVANGRRVNWRVWGRTHEHSRARGWLGLAPRPSALRRKAEPTVGPGALPISAQDN